jgi:hypothetical protein
MLTFNQTGTEVDAPIWLFDNKVKEFTYSKYTCALPEFIYEVCWAAVLVRMVSCSCPAPCLCTPEPSALRVIDKIDG